MAVDGPRPQGDSPSAREAEWATTVLQAALREHAHEVVEAARETVAHSVELRWLVGEWRKQTLTARCAWCRRYRVGERWLDAARTPPIPASRTTHSICDECVNTLRASDRSA